MAPSLGTNGVKQPLAISSTAKFGQRKLSWEVVPLTREPLSKRQDTSIGQDVTASGIPVVFPRFEGELNVFTRRKRAKIVPTCLATRAKPSVSLFIYTDDYALRNDICISEIQGLNKVSEDGEKR